VTFHNPSRSYDEHRSSVRFWGHDGPIEISFLVECDAIARLDAGGGRSEAGILGSFDRSREKILKVATRVYQRNRSRLCVLVAADF
jgi:hypothetical protein